MRTAIWLKAGQLLFELDPRPFQVAIDQAIAQSGAYEAQKVAAEKDVARYTELVKSGGASKQQLEKAIADAASYDAQIDAMKEEVKQYQLDLEFSRITAPIAGRISRAMLTEGNLVNAGGSDPLLTTIVALNPMYVYFSVDERSLQRVMRQRRGKDPAPETPTAHCASRRCRFALAWIRIRAIRTQECSTLPTTASIRRPARFRCAAWWKTSRDCSCPVRACKVRVPVSEPYSAVLVPDTAILSDQDKRYVLVVDDKNVVSRRDINPGQLLDDGMRVVLADIGQWRRGSPPAIGSSCRDCSVHESTIRWNRSKRAAPASDDQSGQP